MTQLAAQLPDLNELRQRALPPEFQDIRAVQGRMKSGKLIDDIIELNRQGITPSMQELINQRKRARLTIQEINGLADDGIRNGINPVDAADDRSATVRFLDMIDLPRNTTANILFGQTPGAGEILASAGETAALGAGIGALGGGPIGALIGAGIGGAASLGSNALAYLARDQVTTERERQQIIKNSRPGTLGQPSVYFSDALKQLGVENKIVRGVVGFTGDVMMDPMTYLSGGGNTVRWLGKEGAAVVSKPASKMLDDIAGHVARHGSLPTDPVYQPFMHLFKNTIKVGDELIDVGGSGASLRERLLQAAQSNQAFGPHQSLQSARQMRNRIAQILRQDILDTARLNPLGPNVSERAGIARDFLRRYAAKSDFQFTMPFSGWMSNRLRTATGGKSADIPIGRFGAAGRLKSKLGRDEAEFVASREAADKLAMSGREAQIQRARSEAMATNELRQFAQDESDEIAGAMEAGVKVPESQVERAAKELEARIIEANDAERVLNDLTMPKETIDLFDAADDAMRTFARKDAATAMVGPSAAVRGLFNKFGGGKTLDKLEEARFTTLNDHAQNARALKIAERQLANKLSKIDPEGIGGAGTAKNLEARAGELAADRAALESGAFGLPTAPRTLSTALKSNYVLGDKEIQFGDDVAKAVWLATQRSIPATIRRQASEFAQAALGIRKASVAKRAKTIRKQLRRATAKKQPLAIPAAMKAANAKSIEKRMRAVDRQLAQASGNIDLVGAMNDDFNTIRMANEESMVASRKAIDELNIDIDKIKSGTFYGLLDKTVRTENAIRQKFQHLHNRNFDQYRREVQEKAPFVRDQVWAAYNADVQKAVKEIPGADVAKVNNALQILISDLATKADPNVRGFPVVNGQPMDDLLQLRDELAATPEGQALLNSPLLHDMAQRNIDDMARILREEQALGIMPDVDPQVVYFHGSMTDKAREALRDLASRVGALPPAGRAKLLTDRLPFTQRKVTNRLFWTDDAGRTREIYVGEMLDPNKPITQEFEAWRQREIFRKQLPENWMPPVYATSAYHLNKHASQVMPRLSLDVVGPIMEEDIVLRTAQRTLMHEQAKAFDTFRRSVLQMAVPLDPQTAKNLPPAIGGGVKYQGQTYKTFPPGVIKQEPGQPFRLPFKEQDMLNFYPAPLVYAVTDYAKRMNDAGQIGPAMRAFDKIQGFWKATTLFHPSWSITNMIGGGFNSLFAAQTRPQFWPAYAAKYGPLVWKIHRGDVLSTTKKLEFAGRLMSERELGELLVREGAVNGGRAIQEMLSATRVGAEEGRKLMHRFATGGPAKRIVGTWFRANAATDDLWRVVTLADRIDQGDDFAEAAGKMVKAHFDYGDLTRFEQKVGLRVWPFYRWMRNNIALQAQLFMQQPAIAASFPKLKNAIEQGFDAEQRVPEEMRPRWMKDNIAVQISDRPNAKFALLSLFTPIQDLLEIGQSTLGGDGMADTLKYFTSSASPLIKAPFELSIGREIFTDREIGDPRMGKISRMQYLAQQLRPYRELSRVYESATAPDQTVGGAAADALRRFTVGGRVQETDDARLERRLAYESGETANELRRAIKRAQGEGDTETAETLSVRLIEVYRDLFNLGMYDSVPKVLRSQFKQQWIQGVDPLGTGE